MPRYTIARLLMLLCVLASAHCASLWQAETLADGNLYADQVARKKGDLITIVVSETTSISETHKTENKRDNSAKASVNLIPGSPELVAKVGATSVGALPALDLSSSKNFKGDSKVEAAGAVKAVITGRVIDVLDNGNLVIEGRRSVKVNLDTKTILITGIIRTADVKSDNTVLSEKLHNFQVAIEGEGPMTRAQSEGFLGQVLDVLWPF